MLPIRTILHPTDFSEHSDYAFRLACSLARDHGSLLIVLHVLERPVLTYAGVMTAPPPPPPSGEERKAAGDRLHKMKPPVLAISVEYLIEEGDPATGIWQVAQERRCDMIVMGTHGRRGLGRLLMGSVAEKVVRKASCPVVTVRSPLKEAFLAPETSATASGQSR